MDVSILLPQLLAVWWPFPVFIVLVVFFKSARFKGWFGEFIIKRAARSLDENIYTAFHNVTLQTLDGTTQIDHVFVSRFGVFVVETKNYKGWIFGSEKQAKWTQKIYRHTNSFQNPLRQNYKHCKAIEALLDIPENSIHSVIVFVGDSTFKTQMPDNVTQGRAFVGYIKSRQDVVFSDEQVLGLVSAIEAGRLQASMATNRAHVRDLKERHSSEADQVCPKCGSEMLWRKAKRGRNARAEFWGCSQFPGCRYVKAC